MAALTCENGERREGGRSEGDGVKNEGRGLGDIEELHNCLTGL